MRAEQEREYVEYVRARVPGLRRTAYRLRGDRHRSDDLVQKVLVLLHRHWRQISRAGAMLLAVALLLPGLSRLFGTDAPASTDRPTLPEEFADYSGLTSRAAARPPGRAIALYEYGSSQLFSTWQTLVVGADRDTYRRVDTDADPAPPVLLSPDGTRVLYHGPRPGTDEFTLLDLTTGGTRVLHSVEWVDNVGAVPRMLAWSPDGRYVAYAVPAPTQTPADGGAAASSTAGEPLMQLAVLDVANGTSTRYPQIGPILAAAFAPDGQRLAVQMPGQSWIVSVHGEKLQPWTPPAGGRLASGAAWSPDGRLLATVSTRPGGTRVRFVDVSGAGRPVPGDLPYDNVLGWRTPATVLVQAWLDDVETDAIIEVSVTDGSRTVLSRFSRSTSCEYGLRRCQPYRTQLATALLGSAGIRPSDPDRGPWVPLTRAPALLSAAVAAAVVARWIMRRRTAHKPPPRAGDGALADGAASGRPGSRSA